MAACVEMGTNWFVTKVLESIVVLKLSGGGERYPCLAHGRPEVVGVPEVIVGYLSITTIFFLPTKPLQSPPSCDSCHRLCTSLHVLKEAYVFLSLTHGESKPPSSLDPQNSLSLKPGSDLPVPAAFLVSL